MKRAFILLVVLVIAAGFPQWAYADDEGYPFTVEIIPPADNIGNTGYYHIPGEPGEKITLQAKLTNITDQPIEIYGVPLNAYSSADGIFYQSAEEVDSSNYAYVEKAYGLAQYIESIDTIALQPGQSEIVDINISVPDIDSGTLLGSIRFVVFADTPEAQSVEQGDIQILIEKHLAVNTGIIIELPGQEQSSIAAGDAGYTGDSVLIPIINQAAIMEENVSVAYEIRDGDAVLFNGSIPAFKMAPMTTFNYLVPTGDTAINKDTCTLYAEINVNGQVMVFNKQFMKETVQVTQPAVNGQEIEGQTARQPQTGADTSNVQQDPFRLWFIIGLAVVIAIFILLIYASYKRSKKRRYRNSI